MEQQNQKRDNSGYLFPNKDKRTEKQPDFRGKMNLAGKEWLVSGWKRNKDGEEMISISLTDPATLPQRDAGAASASPRPAASGPFAKAPAPKAFKPQGGNSGAPGGDELDDLDSLFNGLDDQ